jgi:hypothetical protein
MGPQSFDTIGHCVVVGVKEERGKGVNESADIGGGALGNNRSLNVPRIPSFSSVVAQDL